MFTRSDLALCDAALPVSFGIGEWRLFVKDNKLSTTQSQYSLRTLWRSASILFNIHLPDFCALLNPLTPNDPYMGCTAPLTSKRCILYIYSTNIGTEYFKHGIYSPLFSLQNAVLFIILRYLVFCFIHILYKNVLKLKKNNSGAKRLIC
jgi:hypothetical protein